MERCGSLGPKDAKTRKTKELKANLYISEQETKTISHKKALPKVKETKNI